MGFSIPTLYYSLKEDYHLDEAYKSLNRCCIFDTAFCTSAIYKHEYKTASAWISQVTSEIIEKPRMTCLSCATQSYHLIMI